MSVLVVFLQLPSKSVGLFGLLRGRVFDQRARKMHVEFSSKATEAKNEVTICFSAGALISGFEVYPTLLNLRSATGA